MPKIAFRATLFRACFAAGIYLFFPILSFASSNDLGIMTTEQMALVSAHLREKHIPDQFIPKFYANAGLTRDDPDNSKFEATITQTYTKPYIHKINEIFMAISPLLHAAFRCEGNFKLEHRDSFQMVGTTQTANHTEPSRLFMDSWKFQLCGHHSNVNFLTTEYRGGIPKPQLFYVGKSAADVQLLTDTNRGVSPVAAAELRKHDEKCAQTAPALIDAKVIDGPPVQGRWTEEWQYSYCRQVGTFIVNFAPSPAPGDTRVNAPSTGTIFTARLKSIEPF